MAKKDKVSLEATRNIDSEITTKKDVEATEKEIIGLTEAEKLQKSGWQLIDCHQTPDGKVYKFKKGQ